MTAAGIFSVMRLITVLLALATLAACGSEAGDSAAAPRTKTIATGLHVPWGIAFLPGGDALVSERTTGRILRIPKGGGRPRAAMRVPGVDTGGGEGGLLGLAVSPTYSEDRLIYAYFTSDSDNRIVRFQLGGPPEAIVTGIERGGIHNGGGGPVRPPPQDYPPAGE